MHLVNVTNNYADQIHRELVITPLRFIQIYTLGNSLVTHRCGMTTDTVTITNHHRPVTPAELAHVHRHLFPTKTPVVSQKGATTTLTAKRYA
ncbi:MULTISPECIES: DUF1827 family protein [unclassified Ligilactobacillus]|uniref:DUF1827 family protein n=1 Tax=unclassified Ligilactobacillus TaxID=2767920 RepID=UPI0038525ADF